MAFGPHLPREVAEVEPRFGRTQSRGDSPESVPLRADQRDGCLMNSSKSTVRVEKIRSHRLRNSAKISRRTITELKKEVKSVGHSFPMTQVYANPKSERPGRHEQVRATNGSQRPVRAITEEESLSKRRKLKEHRRTIMLTVTVS